MDIHIVFIIFIALLFKSLVGHTFSKISHKTILKIIVQSIKFHFFKTCPLLFISHPNATQTGTRNCEPKSDF